MSTPPSGSRRGALLLGGAAAVLLQHFVPYGRLVLYPLTLLATWVHEMGHGLAALAGGGGFQRLEIFADASGLAHLTVGGRLTEGVTAAAGLLAPPLVGGLLLALGGRRRLARLLLLLLGAGILVSLALWVRTTIGFAALPPLAAIFIALALRAPGPSTVIAPFVGVILALDSIARVDYLFVTNATIGGSQRASDAANVARAFGGPPLLWGGLIALTAAAIFVAALYVGLRDRGPTRPTHPALLDRQTC